MPTNPDDTTSEDAMTAATVENQPTIPTDDELPRPVSLGPTPEQEREPSPEFKARLMRMMQDVARPNEEDEPIPSDDLAERREQVYTQAWHNSLAAANTEDLKDWQIEDLDADQHPVLLGKFIDALGPAAAKRNLLLGGRVGPGKTSAAIAAGNRAAARGMMVRFVQHATYLRWLRPEGAPNNMADWQIRKRFRDVDLLILDDLGASLDLDREATKFVRDETTALIGDRIDTPGKATIITTNLEPDQLLTVLDDRLVSRLAKRGHAIRFEGPDRRGPRLSW